MDDATLQAVLSLIDKNLHYFEIFQEGVVARFKKDPVLNGSPPILHSIKARIKNREHIGARIRRKSTSDNPITVDNVFERITDISGVRILHLYQQDFPRFHDCVMDQVGRDDWVLDEPPKAYTWDPESRDFFEHLGLGVEVKESFYTSIHYVVRPRAGTEVACEIQTRTLFEEIWGEIDHEINYPQPTTKLANKEQLRVLARLVGAGSRLADAIYRIHRESS